MPNNTKLATVKIGLVVFPEDGAHLSSFPKTTNLLERWIKHNSVLKEPTAINLKKKHRNKNKELPSLIKEKASAQRSIFSILSAGSKKRVSTMAAGPIAPFYDVPPEVCSLIWGYLSPPDIAKAARVNKTWYNFSHSFLACELGDAIVSGVTMNQVQDIDYVLKKKKKVTKQTTFSLRTFIVQNRGDFYTQSETELSNYDFLFFLFESKVTEDDFKTFLEVYDSFYKNKEYKIDCPAVIIGTEDANTLLELKNEHKADYVNVEKDLNSACLNSAIVFEKEKVKQKAISSNPYRFRDFFVMLLFSTVVAAPLFVTGITILLPDWKDAAGFIVLGVGFLFCLIIQAIAVTVDIKQRRKKK